MSRIEPDRLENDEQLWGDWQAVCIKKLLELDPGEFLILQLDDGQGVFIQFARLPEAPHDVLLAELSTGDSADRSTTESLLELGWHPPGSYAVNPGPNLQSMWQSKDSRSWLSHDDAADAASITASAMRFVLGVFDPFRVRVERDSF
ncbi:MAG: hypothetical protein F2840_06655 [Actinobacteria bacterium]|nr:hypothetical protein [Actinomycetota bacterium]